MPTTTADDTSSSSSGVSSISSSSSTDRVEERFRVDRRKLESLMTTAGTGIGDGDGESSAVVVGCPLEKFFKEIELKTGARIFWPSKLKVGAKSKRDPQVKIAGSPEAVQLAKALVLSHCSRKFSKLTLRVDVPHNEHGQLIGRHGALQKEIKSRTGTDIHFPDSNKSSSSSAAAVAAALATGAPMADCAAVKSNQVSLNGLEGPQPAGMEEARRMIRGKQPLALLMLLPSPVPDPSSHAFVRRICDTCKVSVTRQCNSQQPGASCSGWTVRGVAENVEGIAIAVEQLSLYAEYLLRLAAARSQLQSPLPLLVSCRLDFERRHAVAVRERLQLELLSLPPAIAATSGEANLLKATLKQFGVSQFDLTETGAVMSEAGGCRALLQLRSFLLACLPVFLCFDMPCNAFAIEDSLIESLKGRNVEGVAVDFAVRRGGSGGGGAGGGTAARAVTLRTHEGNSHAMYRLLNRIFATPIPATLPDQMAPLGIAQTLLVSPGIAAQSFSYPQSLPYYLTSPPFPTSPTLPPPMPPPSPLQEVEFQSSSASSPTTPPTPPLPTTHQSSTKISSPPPLSPENRAPGAEYSRRKLEVQRIMSRPPVGDRRPTNQWSGYYFSRSCRPSCLTGAAAITNQGIVTSAEAATEAQGTPTSPQQSHSPIQQQSTFAQSCYYQPLAELSGCGAAASPATLHQPATAAASAAAVAADYADDEDGVEALLCLLDKHNLVECAEAMISQEIDLCAFRKLSEEDLRSLGFSYATRQKLQLLIHSIAASPLTL